MVYDFYKEKGMRESKGKLVLGFAAFVVLAVLFVVAKIYMDIIQLDEIGNLSSIYIKNIIFRMLSSAASFVLIFLFINITNIFIRRNLKGYFQESSGIQPRMPNFITAFIISVIGAFLCRDFFYQKALNFFNSSSFGKVDPVFGYDIGYYVFQRPFLMSIYEFLSTLWMFVIVYTLAYYLTGIFSVFNNITLQDLKSKAVLRHNLINLAIFFLIKIFSYKFQKEGILYSEFIGLNGAGFVDVFLWLKYFTVAPYLLLAIVVLSFVFIWKGLLKRAAITIAVFPMMWILATITAVFVQGFYVKPNEANLEAPYIRHNMLQTRTAYGIDKIKPFNFDNIKELTPEIIERNRDTVDNIRIVDYKATLDSNIQLQRNTNFYTFLDGDIINYTISGKEVPVFISAREIDKNKIPETSYINKMYKYTHGYGVVVNPINRVSADGQNEFILSGIRMDSIDKNLRISEPRIYYGELTKDQVVVNANEIKEIDKDGLEETVYGGTGGIQMNFLNRLLFALKYRDFNLIISGYISPQSKLLLNREILFRAQKAVPFLSVDRDPYIIITPEGRLMWVLDAYTLSSEYPYAQPAKNYGNFNYIRNSVKITVDAYNGTVKYYIIDETDPMVQTYRKTYPDLFSKEPFPAELAAHSRYPELLFKIQTDILKRYHLDPDANQHNVATFFSKQELWEIAKYPKQPMLNNSRGIESTETMDIDPYYNLIRLPGELGTKEELILMRPFTPSGGRHNMVSWLGVRNSFDKYGEMVLFSFPKDTNIFGPDQVEVYINQIGEVSEYQTLWGQNNSRVFKGSLLVIPIEESILYVEPIYIQSNSQSSIPQIRKVVVGYQKGNEFKSGVGDNLEAALRSLFKDLKPAAPTPTKPQNQTSAPNGKETDAKIINDILQKYDILKKQLEEMGNLINQLK